MHGQSVPLAGAPWPAQLVRGPTRPLFHEMLVSNAALGYDEQAIDQ